MKKLYGVAIFYLYLPIMIFILGWIDLWVSIPLTAITLVALYFCYKQIIENEQEEFSLKKEELLLFFVLFFLFFVFGGGGDLFVQDFDWNKHHAILYDLVKFDWPVVYSNDVLLTYYLGQYIVPAFLGKLFGHSNLIALWSMTVWNAIGLTIVHAMVCQYLQVKSAWKKAGVFLILIFWGGATNLGSIIYQWMGHDVTLGSHKWLDSNRILIHFAGNLDALRGAFQHVIVPWISCSIFMKNRKNYSIYVMLALPLLFSSTFGFVYYVVIMLACFVWDLLVEKNKKKIWQLTFSLTNIALVPASCVILIYLSGNFMGEKPYYMGWDLLNMFCRLDFYLIFIAVEFVGYMVFLYKEKKNDVLFYIILCELLFIPFVSLGLYNDLCSRGGIPARFILMVWCIEQFYKYGLKNWRNFGIAVIFMFSAVNALDEAVETVQYTVENGIGDEHNLQLEWDSFDGWAGNPAVRVDNAYNYYTMNYSQHIFYKIAKK